MYGINRTTQYILVLVLFLGATAYATSFYVEKREEEIVSKIQSEIEAQEQTLSHIADITDRNGADEVVESIIRDCSIAKRQRFDTLLDRLGTLGSAELAEAQDLFDACARFYAERKALMVSRMEREFEVYRDMVDMLRIVDDSITVDRYQVDTWKELVTLEQKRSDIFARQVRIQQDIITALQNGEPVSSETIQSLVREADDSNQESMVLNQRIDAERKKLTDL